MEEYNTLFVQFFNLLVSSLYAQLQITPTSLLGNFKTFFALVGWVELKALWLDPRSFKTVIKCQVFLLLYDVQGFSF